MKLVWAISLIILTAFVVPFFSGKAEAGSLVAWGQGAIPDDTGLTDIAAGYNHSLAVKSDGSLLAWGYNDDGQCDVPDGNNFETVAAGGWHNLALKPDGSLSAWGYNDYGQCNVPGDTGFTAVAVGWFHSLALKSNGTLVAWGRNDDQQTDLPPQMDFTAIAASARHNLALNRRTRYVVHPRQKYRAQIHHRGVCRTQSRCRRDSGWVHRETCT